MLGILALAALQLPGPPVNIARVMRAPQIVSRPLPADAPKFADVPNVAITYYDVTGHDIPEIQKSVAKQAPRDRLTNAPLPRPQAGRSPSRSRP